LSDAGFPEDVRGNSYLLVGVTGDRVPSFVRSGTLTFGALALDASWSIRLPLRVTELQVRLGSTLSASSLLVSGCIAVASGAQLAVVVDATGAFTLQAGVVLSGAISVNRPWAISSSVRLASGVRLFGAEVTVGSEVVLLPASSGPCSWSIGSAVIGSGFTLIGSGALDTGSGTVSQSGPYHFTGTVTVDGWNAQPVVRFANRAALRGRVDVTGVSQFNVQGVGGASLPVVRVDDGYATFGPGINVSRVELFGGHVSLGAGRWFKPFRLLAVPSKARRRALRDLLDKLSTGIELLLLGRSRL
jgi:hypothetical protein